MLGGAKGRHWHLLIFFFRLYVYGNNFYESACQNLDIAGFAGSLHKHRQKNCENTDAPSSFT